MWKNAKSRMIAWAVIFALFLLLLIAPVWYTGSFKSVAVEKRASGPFSLAYLEHIGPYHNVRGIIKQVGQQLDKAGIRTGPASGIYYDDPASTDKGKLRSRVGFLVSNQAVVPEPLRIESIPKRDVVVGLFEGSPLIGPFKAYPKMKQWMQERGYKATGPALEIYHETGLIEYQLPVAKRP